MRLLARRSTAMTVRDDERISVDDPLSSVSTWTPAVRRPIPDETEKSSFVINRRRRQAAKSVRAYGKRILTKFREQSAKIGLKKKRNDAPPPMAVRCSHITNASEAALATLAIGSKHSPEMHRHGTDRQTDRRTDRSCQTDPVDSR